MCKIGPNTVTKLIDRIVVCETCPIHEKEANRSWSTRAIAKHLEKECDFHDTLSAEYDDIEFLLAIARAQFAEFSAKDFTDLLDGLASLYSLEKNELIREFATDFVRDVDIAFEAREVVDVVRSLARMGVKTSAKFDEMVLESLKRIDDLTSQEITKFVVSLSFVDQNIEMKRMLEFVNECARKIRFDASDYIFISLALPRFANKKLYPGLVWFV